MRRHLLQAVSLGLLASFVAGCATIGPAQHPNFTARQPHLHTFAVLPPSVEVRKLTFNGQEFMHELAEPTRVAVVEAVRTELAAKGYELVALDTNALESYPEVKRSLHTIQQLFDERLMEYKKRSFWSAHTFNYSVGSEANVLADSSHSDALIVTRCEGLKKSGGEIAKDWAQTVLIAAATFGGMVVIHYPAVTLIQIGIIDGDTGDILWYAENGSDMRFDIANQEHLNQTVSNLIDKFPRATPIAQTSAHNTTEGNSQSTW